MIYLLIKFNVLKYLYYGIQTDFLGAYNNKLQIILKSKKITRMDYPAISFTFCKTVFDERNIRLKLNARELLKHCKSLYYYIYDQDTRIYFYEKEIRAINMNSIDIGTSLIEIQVNNKEKATLDHSMIKGLNFKIVNI